MPQSKKLNEAKVGVFYYIKDKVYADSIDVRDGEEYGNFVNYSSHFDYWDRLTDRNPSLSLIDYDYFPRGRVVYDKKLHKYIIYLDKKLNYEDILGSITTAFGLSSGSYIVNPEDEHYSSFPENLKVVI